MIATIPIFKDKSLSLSNEDNVMINDNAKIEKYMIKINNRITIDKICFFLEILGLKALVINKSKKISPKLLNIDSIILNLPP